MNTIILKPKKEESLLRFHPWVFSGAIARIILDKNYPYAEPQEGDVVAVCAADSKALGVGHWQVGSIAVRILAFGTDRLGDDFWHERIRAAYTLRRSLGLIRADNNTYRLIHGEGDFLPGLVIDHYADTAVIQAHSVGMHRARYQIAEALKAVTGVENIYYKSDDTLPFKAPIEGDKVGYLSLTQNREPRTENPEPHLAIWVTAIIFSFVHFQFYGFVPRMLMGALLGYMLCWTGSLWIAMLMHFTNNAIVTILYFICLRGGYDTTTLDAIGSGDTLWLGILSIIVSVVGIYLFRRSLTMSNASSRTSSGS